MWEESFMELAYKLTEVSSSYSSRRCQAGQPWDEPCPVPTHFCCFQDARHTLCSFPRLAAWGRVHVLLVTAMGRAGLGQGGAEYVGKLLQGSGSWWEDLPTANLMACIRVQSYAEEKPRDTCHPGCHVWHGQGRHFTHFIAL